MTSNRLNISITVMFVLCIASIGYFLEKISIDQSSTLEQMLSQQDLVRINQYRSLFNIESELVVLAIQTPAELPASRIADIEQALRSVNHVSSTFSSVSLDSLGVGRKKIFFQHANTEVILLLIAPAAQQLEVVSNLSREIEQAATTLLKADESVVIAGMPQVRAASWQIGNRDVKLMLPLLVLITLGISMLLFNSYTALALSLLLTSLTTLICLVLQFMVKAEINALLVFVVPVIWAIATLDAFHLYSRTAIVSKRALRDSARVASREIFIPCLLTTITTAGCFITLTFLDTSPLIVSFGVWGAVGALVAFALTFTLGEKLLSMGTVGDVCPRWPGLFAFKLVRLAQRHYRLTAVTWGVVMLLALASISQVEVATSFPQVFTAGKSIARDINQLKELTGSDLNPIDIVIEADDLHGEQNARMASAALLTNNYLNTIEETRLVLPIGVMDEKFMIDFSRHLQEEPPNRQATMTDLTSRFSHWINEEHHAMRLQLHLSETSFSRKGEVFNWIAHFDETMLSHHSIALSGSGYFHYLTEKRGLKSLLVSSLLSLLIVVVTLFWITRSRLGVVIAISVCLVPSIILAGCMAVFSVPWTIAMLPMPALLLGLMTDDTIHMISPTSNSRRHDDVNFRRNAITAGPALLATTLVLSGAIATLALSGIQTNQYLGILIPLGLLLAFLCNLTLLPALNFWLHKSSQLRH